MLEKEHCLYNQLNALAESDEYPLHMPGHKRNSACGLPGHMERLDITEIVGYDNLHHPEGILKEAMENAAAFFHAEETRFLVNGSTSGILSAISCVIGEGDTLILGRNAHVSAYHAAYLRGARVVSLYPETLSEYQLYGVVTPQRVSQVLAEHPEAKAVMLTSPTYDGFVSDIGRIAEIVHEHHKILIVDEAHGAHFGLDARMPESAVSCGADLVIQSIHKTLPSLTQTAVLHVNGTRVDRDRLHRFLAIYQSSSPSYLLMGSLDYCIRDLQQNAKSYFDHFFTVRALFYQRCVGLRRLHIISDEDCLQAGMKAQDPGKILVSCRNTGMSGEELQKLLLSKYHLQLEMAGNDYVLAIMTIMDTEQGMLRFADALCEIDAQLSIEVPSAENASAGSLFAIAMEERCHMTAERTIKEALDAPEEQTEVIPLAESIGRISCESIYIYPPGIPVILPGERMTAMTCQLLQEYQRNGLSVQGMSDERGQKLRCMRE